MPGQLFNLSRYFKKKQDEPQYQDRSQTTDQQVAEETREVATTTTTSGSVAGLAQPYSGIGYTPGGGRPYSGIGYPSAPTVSTPPVQQTTVVRQTSSAKQPAAGSKQEAGSQTQQPVTYHRPPPTAAVGSMTMQKRVGMDILTRLTQRSTQALMIGVTRAKELKVRYVDTEHVLWGLLTDSGVFQLVSDLKVIPKEIQEELEKQFKKGNFVGPPQFSPRVKRVLELSLSTARSLGYEFISPEHILLSLAQEGEGMAAQLMAKHGLTVEALNKKITGKKEGVGEKEKESRKASSLEQFAEDLTQKAREGKLDPVVARSAEIERVIHILSRRTKNNPVLIGDAGVGKTAIVEGLAQRIASGDVPETLLNKRILQLDLMSLIAGARHRGEFEERLKNVIKEIKAASGGIILFIDEIHNMVGAGAGSEGTMDASNILKPSLARGELQTIGTTTITEYRRYLEKDPALERRFQPVLVVEPTAEASIEMLRALRDKYEAFHKVSIPDETIEAAVRLSQRYVGDRFLPDKAVDLIDEAASSVRLPAISLPEEIKSIQDKLKRLNEERKDAQKLGDTVKLTTLNREIEELDRNLEEKRKAYEVKKSTTTNVVSPETIQEIVSRWTNIPLSKLTESESKKLLKLEDIIHKRIINQEQAVAAVAEAVRRGRAGLKSAKRPIGSFIFMGPTGVGKTELAKVLAEILFGSEEMMVRLDMTEYMEKHEVAKLIGAPPGYVGYEEGGQLTEAVRRRPYCVVLLDEIEKAHLDVFNILIQILDDGRLTDNKGRVISFKNTIVICTSNIGTGLIQQEMLELDQGEVSLPALTTYVVSPTGRQMVTLGGRMWEYQEKMANGKWQMANDKKNDTSVSEKKKAANLHPDGQGWLTKLLKDYFAGNQVTNADLTDSTQKLPIDGFDTHLIFPSGEEMITKSASYFVRKSTTAKNWTTDTLINYFKNHLVLNALPDRPEEQLPTAKLDTNAVSPQEMQIVTLGNRFWQRQNLTTQDWLTGTLADYLKDSLVLEETKASPSPTRRGKGEEESIEEELTLAKKVVRQPELQLPTKAWDVHLFTPLSEEIIIVGDRYWMRKDIKSQQWFTAKLERLFKTSLVLNADSENEDQLLPLGQELNQAKKQKEAEFDERFAFLSEKLLAELRKFFRPELLNRFDEIIVFRLLTVEHMLAIVDLQLGLTAKLLEEQNIGFMATPQAKREIVILGYDPLFGARPLRRTIQREIENKISSLLIEAKIKAGETIVVDHDGNEFLFSVKALPQATSLKETELETKAGERFSCRSCGAEFDTETVPKATIICPMCASSQITPLGFAKPAPGEAIASETNLPGVKPTSPVVSEPAGEEMIAMANQEEKTSSHELKEKVSQSVGTIKPDEQTLVVETPAPPVESLSSYFDEEGEGTVKAKSSVG